MDKVTIRARAVIEYLLNGSTLEVEKDGTTMSYFMDDEYYLCTSCERISYDNPDPCTEPVQDHSHCRVCYGTGKMPVPSGIRHPDYTLHSFLKMVEDLSELEWIGVVGCNGLRSIKDKKY